jgi:hypothetical protein
MHATHMQTSMGKIKNCHNVVRNRREEKMRTKEKREKGAESGF